MRGVSLSAEARSPGRIPEHLVPAKLALVLLVFVFVSGLHVASVRSRKACRMSEWPDSTELTLENTLDYHAKLASAALFKNA